MPGKKDTPVFAIGSVLGIDFNGGLHINLNKVPASLECASRLKDDEEEFV